MGEVGECRFYNYYNEYQKQTFNIRSGSSETWLPNDKILNVLKDVMLKQYKFSNVNILEEENKQLKEQNTLLIAKNTKNEKILEKFEKQNILLNDNFSDLQFLMSELYSKTYYGNANITNLQYDVLNLLERLKETYENKEKKYKN